MTATERFVQLACLLDRAQRNCRAIEPLTDEHSDLTVDDAYEIQAALVQETLNRGNSIAGKKVGFTSPAVQQGLGLVEPGYGYLFDGGAIKNEGQVAFDGLLQPRIEPEIAFVMRETLRAPVTVADVLSVTDIVPAFEILDSRITDWKVKGPDIIADNSAHGLFVIGDTKRAAHEIDIPQIRMELENKGSVVASGAATAVLGDPTLAVVWLANKLSERTLQLQAGEVVLTGSLCTPLVVARGDELRATFGDLGSVAVSFV
jgi:2-keto-4-pentenoate hydratase